MQELARPSLVTRLACAAVIGSSVMMKSGRFKDSRRKRITEAIGQMNYIVTDILEA